MFRNGDLCLLSFIDNKAKIEENKIFYIGKTEIKLVLHKKIAEYNLIIPN